MQIETYNAIAALQDQFIAFRGTTFGTRIVIMADNKETINTITALARKAGCKVKKNIVGKGSSDAEMHLLIS